MPKAVATVVLLLFCGLARGQEPIPTEQAQDIGKQLVEVARKVDDVQVKADVDPEKAAGVHGQQRGALAIPDKGLSEEGMSGAGRKVVPVGHLWFRGISPLVEGQAAGRARLRPMNVTIGEQDHELFFFVLGARKQDSGDWELLVYGKDKEPLAKVPLKKADGGAQDLPIQVDGKRNDDDTGRLTLKLLGKYEAAIGVGEPGE